MPVSVRGSSTSKRKDWSIKIISLKKGAQCPKKGGLAGFCHKDWQQLVNEVTKNLLCKLVTCRQQFSSLKKTRNQMPNSPVPMKKQITPLLPVLQGLISPTIGPNCDVHHPSQLFICQLTAAIQKRVFASSCSPGHMCRVRKPPFLF